MHHSFLEILLHSGVDLRSVLRELFLGDECIVPFDHNFSCLLDPGSLEVHSNHKVFVVSGDDILCFALMTSFLGITFIIEFNEVVLGADLYSVRSDARMLAAITW